VELVDERAVDVRVAEENVEVTLADRQRHPRPLPAKVPVLS
jgi:hypothetical protein